LCPTLAQTIAGIRKIPETPRAAYAPANGALWQLVDLPELRLCLPKPKHPVANGLPLIQNEFTSAPFAQVMAGNESGCKEKIGDAVSKVLEPRSQHEWVKNIYARGKAS
jgi:hypothetical protein